MSLTKSLALAVRGLGAVALMAANLSATAADAFPSKEIHFIVPWNAGGSNDISARTLSQIASEDGVTIVVENLAGATGAIGMTKVANAAPDGYTIGMGTSSTLALIAQGLTPLRNDQFAPIARVTTDPLILLVPAKSEYGTLESFLAHVKANPGKVSIGIPGTNNLNHIFAVMTGRAAGAETLPIPYTGGSKVVADLSGKQIEAGVLKPSESKAQIDGGLVKPIAVFGNERLKALPDVPTFKEKGYDVFPYGADGLHRRAGQDAAGRSREADRDVQEVDQYRQVPRHLGCRWCGGRRPDGRRIGQGDRQRPEVTE
jgi:tripartite-type tricarboxylate transporter receptor subunit TctC